MTSAVISTKLVCAVRKTATIVCFHLTFILVYAVEPVAFKPFSTFAFISTDCVYTRCMLTAIMDQGYALINILTGPPITLETWQTRAVVATNCISARCMGAAIMNVCFTLVYVFT